MRSDWFRYAGLALGALWAGWWVFFGVASGAAEKLSPLGILIHASVPGLFFAATVLAAWRWPTVGGALLLAEAVVVAVGYPLMVRGSVFYNLSTIGFILATMALPPLIAGVACLRSAGGAPSH